MLIVDQRGGVAGFTPELWCILTGPAALKHQLLGEFCKDILLDRISIIWEKQNNFGKRENALSVAVAAHHDGVIFSYFFGLKSLSSQIFLNISGHCYKIHKYADSTEHVLSEKWFWQKEEVLSPLCLLLELTAWNLHQLDESQSINQSAKGEHFADLILQTIKFHKIYILAYFWVLA